MTIEQELSKLSPKKETLLTIGVFDGVHLGHQYLVKHLKEQADGQGLLSGVVTFKAHPQSVLSPQGKLPWLNSLEDRTKLIQSLGVELIAILPFTRKLAQLSAHEFITLLKTYLKMRGLIIGPDFALGKGREGNADTLRILGQELDFTGEVIPPVILNGQVISSTNIRQALAQGDVERTMKLTGRHFNLTAQVIPGAERGRTLGFPTANLNIKSEQALPHRGVYATVTYIGHTPHLSVTNIGTRPTFGSGKTTVEVHLLSYEGQLYRQKLNIEFIARLRDEKRFNAADELKAQISRDVERARAILATQVQNLT